MDGLLAFRDNQVRTAIFLPSYLRSRLSCWFLRGEINKNVVQMIVLPILLALLIFNPNAHAVAFFNRWSGIRPAIFPVELLPAIASFGHFCANYAQITLFLTGFLDKFLSG
jgi:hypothetical protein